MVYKKKLVEVAFDLNRKYESKAFSYKKYQQWIRLLQKRDKIKRKADKEGKNYKKYYQVLQQHVTYLRTN